MNFILGVTILKDNIFPVSFVLLKIQVDERVTYENSNSGSKKFHQ